MCIRFITSNTIASRVLSHKELVTNYCNYDPKSLFKVCKRRDEILLHNSIKKKTIRKLSQAMKNYKKIKEPRALGFIRQIPMKKSR